MTTYGDLKARVIAETTRDDLADDYAGNLAQAIVEAVDHYASQRFWFNEIRTTASTVAANASVTAPSGIRWIDEVIVSIGSGYRLMKDELTHLELLALNGGAGQPTRYADYAPSGVRTLRLWPTPTSIWSLVILGTKDEPALVNTGDSNAWTLYAYDLIAARTKFLLCRDLFRDDKKMQTAGAAEADAISRLRAETGRRLGTGRMKATFP